MALHAALPADECHEAKQIIGAVAADAGKVITPSIVNGVGELRLLTVSEISGLTSSLGTLNDDIALAEADIATNTASIASLTTAVNGKLGIAPRVSTVAYAANIGVNASSFDVLACDSLTGNVTVDAPTGTPADGQRLTIRLTQDATGGRTITYNPAFVTMGATDTTLSTTETREFVYHSTRAKWIQLAFTTGI